MRRARIALRTERARDVKDETEGFHWRFEQHRFVFPEDALHGTLMFAGRLLLTVDEVAAILAVRYARAPLATASMDALEFYAPIRVGDMLTLRGALTRVGTRSMEVEIQVLAEVPFTGDIRHTCTAYLTFVKLRGTGGRFRRSTRQPRSSSGSGGGGQAPGGARGARARAQGEPRGRARLVTGSQRAYRLAACETGDAFPRGAERGETMSGHSKWSQIKRKKAKTDQARGKVFSKLVREITTAARTGGDPKMNMRLKTAIEEAKAVNMPADTLKRAIQKGTGELPGETYEEITYEGYGPGGVAVMVKVLTDNKNRTAPEIRHAFTKFSGNLGEVGSVGWMFDRKGIIQVEATRVDEDELLGLALDAGAADLRRADAMFEITATPQDLDVVRRALEGRGVPIQSAEVTYVPQSTVRLEGKDAQQVLRLVEGLEELDDVQHVYANFDIPDEVLEAQGAA